MRLSSTCHVRIRRLRTLRIESCPHSSRGVSRAGRSQRSSPRPWPRLFRPLEPRAQELPSRLADSTFWQLVTGLLGARGVLPVRQLRLERDGVPARHSGAAGGDQARWRLPRRGPRPELHVHRGPEAEALVHLRHPARQPRRAPACTRPLIELSANRADFLSMLFSRPRPAGLDTSATADTPARAPMPASPAERHALPEEPQGGEGAG